MVRVIPVAFHRSLIHANAEPLGEGEDHPSSEGRRYCDGPSRYNLLPVAG